MSAPIIHIRAGRKAPHNLCNAPTTGYDIPVREAHRLVREARTPQGFLRCECCFDRLLARDWAASCRVED